MHLICISPPTNSPTAPTYSPTAPIYSTELLRTAQVGADGAIGRSGPQCDHPIKDNKGAKINSIRTKKAIESCDIVIVKFGEKYKQWNAAFDAGYAAALKKSIIVIHNDEHQHPLKEVDAAASAVAKDQMQAFKILKYILNDTWE